jgi:hypothetical protein
MKPSYKIIAAVLVVIAAVAHLLNSGYADWNAGNNSVYVLLMLGLFFTKEKPSDERVQELKLKALTVAFAVGYATTFSVKLALQQSAISGSMSAFDFMFVTLVTAFFLFHGWRWEDGRDDGAA